MANLIGKLNVRIALVESNLSRTENPNLTTQSFQAIEGKLEDFIRAFAGRMGSDQFKDRENSLHLSAPGWQVLGLIFHDLNFRLGNPAREMYSDTVIDRLAVMDWSRFNPDWLGLIGEPERDKITQEVVIDERGRQRVALSRAGRTTIAAMLEYVREKCGLTELLEELAQKEAKDELLNATQSYIPATTA